MRFGRTKAWGTVAVLAAATLLATAACGSSPTDTAKPAASGTSGSAAASGAASAAGDARGYDDVYAAVKGLTGQARQQKLIELAKAEGGTVSVYHNGTLTSEIKGFTDATGIKVTDFQATGERVSEKVEQEGKAGRPGSDLVIDGADANAILYPEKYLAPLQTPNLTTINSLYEPQDPATAYQIPLYGIMYVPTYNTNLVKASDVPTSWDDFFKSYKNSVAIELTDWTWFHTLVTKWFMAKEGMTQEQATALIAGGLKGATDVDGHTLEAQLLASGQYSLAITFFAQYYNSLKEKGAPIAFIPNQANFLPLLSITVNAALTANATHPAAALLFLEYLTSVDGQKLFVKQGYLPSINDYPDKTLLDTYPSPIIDDTAAKLSTADQQKWQDAWNQLLQASGGKKATGS